MNVGGGLLVVGAAIALSPALAAAQVGGNLAAYPPVDIELEITTQPDGPRLSETEIRLVTGEYYRLDITSDGRHDWRFESPGLLQNSHIRVLTIDGLEVHLQGLSFHGIEFDEAGTASFTFTPIRPGTYSYTVGDAPPPGAAGIADDAQRAVGRFVVE